MKCEHGKPIRGLYDIKPFVNKWDKYFLLLSEVTAQQSKDPSTRVGSVIVRPNRTVAGLGWNGFPSEMTDEDSWLNDRQEKYDRIIHAEMNALLNSRDNSYEGYTAYTYPFMPCHRCFVMLAQAGVKTCIAPIPTADQLSRWKDSFSKTIEFAGNCGVRIIEVPYESQLRQRSPHGDGHSGCCSSWWGRFVTWWRFNTRN